MAWTTWICVHPVEMQMDGMLVATKGFNDVRLGLPEAKNTTVRLGQQLDKLMKDKTQLFNTRGGEKE